MTSFTAARSAFSDLTQAPRFGAISVDSLSLPLKSESESEKDVCPLPTNTTRSTNIA